MITVDFNQSSPSYIQNLETEDNIGLILRNEKGEYHVLALSLQQHRLLNMFVNTITKREPAKIALRCKIEIKKE